MEKKLIHFTAVWCRPCKAMEPVIKMFIDENPDVIYEKVDIDEDPAKALEYKIMSVPTFISYQDNNVTNIVSGAMPKSKLEEMFKNG